MGKRIHKSRRHKKLKSVDPFRSFQATRKLSGKHQINEPPTDIDDQEVPHKMKELIDLKNLVKLNKFKRKKKKIKLKDDFIIVRKDKFEDDQPGMTRPLKPLPERLKQMKYESEYQFLGRIQQLANSAIAEAQIEQKYDIDVIVDTEGNSEVIVGKRDMGTMKKEKRKKYKQKQREKKKKKLGDEDRPQILKDEIPFGEVVLEPPTFSARPRKGVETKAGSRSLLLTELVQNEQHHLKKASQINQLTLKRKKLPPGQRRMLENERQRVVDLYRRLKKGNKN